MSRLLVSGAVVAALAAVIAPVPASGVGITYDKLAYLTFNAPVQVPGATLTAGTYRFHLTNPDTSRNVLQVLSQDGAIVHAMFQTLGDIRTIVTADPEVTFRETPAGVPPAVRSLFYGGESVGYEFVYPKGWPIMTAAPAPQPEITYAPYPAVRAPEPVIEPEAEPLEPVAEPITEAEPALQAEPADLPRTATPLPLAVTGGLVSVLVGLGLGLLRRRGV